MSAVKKTRESPYQIAWRLKRMGYTKVKLDFSGGKESSACWLALQAEGVQVVPMMAVPYPHLEVTRQVNAYFEDYFKTKVFTYPMSRWYRCWKDLLYLDPYLVRVAETLKIKERPSADRIVRIQSALAGLPDGHMTVAGLRASDSRQRFLSIYKHGVIAEGNLRCYPVAWCNESAIYSMLIHHGLKLPSLYKDLHQSFDVPRAKILDWLQINLPEDYQRILAFSPLIRLEQERYRIGGSDCSIR